MVHFGCHDDGIEEPNIGDAGLKGAALKLSNVTDVVAFSHVRRLCSVYKIGPRVMVCQL